MSEEATPEPSSRGPAQESAEVIAGAIEALSAKDPEMVDELFDDSVEWRPALSPEGAVGEGRVYRGKEGVFEYMQDVAAGLDGVQIDVVRIDSLGPDRVLSRTRVTANGSASGIPLDVPVWGLWQVRDGKLIRGEAFLSEEEALEAAGLSD